MEITSRPECHRQLRGSLVFVGWAPPTILPVRHQADEDGGRCPLYEDFSKSHINSYKIVDQILLPRSARDRTADQHAAGRGLARTTYNVLPGSRRVFVVVHQPNSCERIGQNSAGSGVLLFSRRRARASHGWLYALEAQGFSVSRRRGMAYAMGVAVGPSFRSEASSEGPL
jgi:hypothetical protein